MNIFGMDSIPRTLLLGVAVIVIGMGITAWWLLGSHDVVLFDHLDAQQLDAVSAELDGAAIEYHVDRKAGAVKVAPKDEQRARLMVMSSGNAFRSAVGFELFNGSDFGMTDFAQKINYQRAIEGELARTIGALDEIKYARVHLVLPEHGLLRQQSREPRASLTLFVERGALLTPEQIRGVQRIAAAAVPELKESNVTVTDESGRILSTAVADEADLEGSGRLAQKQAVERYLADKVRAVLTKALGAEHFAVSVDAALDYTHKSTKTERVLEAGPGGGVKRLKESSRGDRSDPGGSDRQKEIEYSLGREVEQVEQSAGAIRRVQVGVIIDRDMENADVDQLRDLVAAAVGIDAQRGDRVTVVRHSIAMQRAIERAEKEVLAPATSRPMTTSPPPSARFQWNWTTGAVVIALLLALGTSLIAQRIALRRRRLRLQKLRHRLQDWIEAEQIEAQA